MVRFHENANWPKILSLFTVGPMLGKCFRLSFVLQGVQKIVKILKFFEPLIEKLSLFLVHSRHNFGYEKIIFL